MNTQRDICPHCAANLQGPPIPDQPGDHYSRVLCVEVSHVYDGGLFFECPDCGGTWHRWPEGHPLRVRAEPFIISQGPLE